MRLKAFLLTLAALVAVPCLAVPPNRLTQEEVTNGWMTLFDGETLIGWRATSEANWKVKDGAITVSEGQPGLLVSVAIYNDYTLKADFRAKPNTNSGVFLRTQEKPSSPASDCYEVNIVGDGANAFPTGSLVERAKSTGKGPDDAWHTLTVRAQAGRVRVSIDDEEVLDYTDPKPIRGGHIGLQFNAGPVEFKNLKIKTIGGRPAD